MHAVDIMPYSRGRTATADALRMTYDVMFTQERGDRQTVPNYAIVLTDGEGTVEPERTLPEAIEVSV